jgi:hypothetical protein
LGIEKVSLPATSDDAASDSDTKKKVRRNLIFDSFGRKVFVSKDYRRQHHVM